MKNHYRRVVTGTLNGKSVFRSDGEVETYEFKSIPGYKHTLFWVNSSTPDLRKEQRFDRYPDSVVPGAGGTSLQYVTYPSGAVFTSPTFDAEASRKESLDRLRGLADHFEKEDPGMHKTHTVDYAIVFEGEIWLELDDGKTVHLKKEMSLYRTARAMRGEIREQLRLRCCSFEWRKRVKIGVTL